MNYYIYDVDNLTDVEYEKWFSLMTLSKQERVSKYKDTMRKRCSVAGEMLVKKHIAKTLDISPEELTITEDTNGKPYIENCKTHFNISHCENILAYAFSKDEIGVDIEKTKKISPSIIKRFFSEDEQKYVYGSISAIEIPENGNNTEMIERFYRIYTLKEAICKKSGVGIKGLKSADALPFLNKSFRKDDFIISVI